MNISRTTDAARVVNPINWEYAGPFCPRKQSAFYCCLEPGHKGDHIAVGMDGHGQFYRVLMMWDNENDPCKVD